MGNIPLCVPKKGPAVFTEGYDLHPGSPGKQYYPYNTSLEDLSRAEFESNLEAASQYYQESKRHSFFIGDDTAIVGLEIDQDSDQVYSGLLQFQYFNGNETETQNIHVKSSDTVADLIPTLRATFLKRSSEQSEGLGEGEEGRSSYVALVQGEMERELDTIDKPLEIALDCSSKGLASPKFVFKSPLSEHTDTPLSAHQTNRFTSYVGSLALPSGSENEDSPTVAKRLTTEFDQTSMNSFGSALSLSSKSSKTKSTSSLVLKSKKKKLTHTLSNQETGTIHKTEVTPESPPAHHHSSSQLNIDSPGSKRRHNGRPKSIMSNFITRSLRVRRKHKQSADTPTTEPSKEDVDGGFIPQIASEGNMNVSSLVSPLPSERRFTMSAVMHVYYMKPKQVQLYKSVLVSENSTARQVVSQALERYNMKLHNPEHFGLYEVIGKWQEICSTLPSKLSYQTSTSANIASSTLPAKPTSPLVNRRTAVEEFIVCYSRKLDMEECPYNAQYFLDTKEGYTRRFELRKLPTELEPDRKDSTVSASMLEGATSADPDSPDRDQRSVSIPHMHSKTEGSPGIFGQTNNRKRAKRNRVTADTSHKSPEDETPNEVTRVQVTRPSSSEDDITANVSILTCSSPENTVSPSTYLNMSSQKNQTASLDQPFLLNVCIQDPQREELIRFLTNDTTVILTKSSYKETSNESEIHLFNPDFQEPVPVCSICNLPIVDSKCFTISPKNDSVSISINGHSIQQSTTLTHGDIISIGNRHRLLFQNFSSYVQGSNWEPRPVDSTLKAINPLEQFRPSSQMSTSSNSTNGEDSHQKLTIKSAALNSNSRSGSEISLTVEDVDSHTVTEIDVVSIPAEDPPAHSPVKPTNPTIAGQTKQSAHTRLIMRQMLQNDSPDREDPVVSMPSNKEVCDNEPDDLPQSPVFSPHQSKQLKHSVSLPTQTAPRKVMFSYSLTEEDALLTLLINQFTSPQVSVPLGPAYALTMCTEYGMMCYGPRAMTAFVKKATSLIQNKAWECCKKLADWQVDPDKAKKPLSIMKELFIRLEVVLVLLANALEFHHFLFTSCESLNLSTPLTQREGDLQGQNTEDTLVSFHNVLVYTFQQAFYSISRVLYHALPVMLDGCTEDKLKSNADEPIVIDQAVDFLQSLFDLLTKLHVHLEVMSQFYANIFFFTNAVMFNGLIDQGVELALYQHSSGQALRANLNLLEGWACQVGFRDTVLHYLAKFSGAVDLLATPPNQLLELDWNSLRKEYPMLHPAQLHYLLSSYLLPVSHLPSHWTPPQEDAIHAVKGDALRESFDHHPSFELPSSGYMVDLTRPPQDMDQLQAYLDELRKQLKNPKRSVDVVPVSTGSKPITTPYMNSDPGHTSPHDKPHQKRTLLINDSPVRARRNIGSNTESQEDLLQDSRNTRNKQHDKFILEEHKQNGSTTHQSQTNGDVKNSRKSARRTGKEQIVERVHSIVGPRSFKTPEKFLLEPDDSSWLEANFPLDAETVTIPRGDKGFGFIMVEEKEPGSTVPAIFVHEVLPDSMADKCALVRGGDKILAIDGQLLDGADYIIADKYLKEAEDDVTLVILRNQNNS